MKIQWKRPFVRFDKTLPDSKQYYLKYTESQPFNYNLERFDPIIRQSFDSFQGVDQFEYVFNYPGECFIEPVQGWAFTPREELIYESIPYSKERGIHFPSYIKSKIMRWQHRAAPVNKAISIRYAWDNYYHFLNDVVGQLYLLERENIAADIPVIMPAWAFKSKHVNFFFERMSVFKRRKFILQQDNELIKVKSIYFLKNTHNIKAHFDFALNELDPIVDLPTNPRKIFLTRKNTAQRNLANPQEIELLMNSLGYEIIDAVTMPLEEQLSMFSGLTHLVGIHGAGLTNIIFNRNKNFKILEIFPANIQPPHFFLLSEQYGFEYDAFCSSAHEINAHFAIDPTELKAFMTTKNFI